MSPDPFLDDVSAAFSDAWLECISKHGATLVSGPCDECCEKHARNLRTMDGGL